jgi:ABC-type protease/lipase transport system fused ATPase/permease subunit
VGDWRTRRLDAEGFRRLSLALAIAGDPDLVVLDDPWVLSDTLREIAGARARGAAVLVASDRPGGLAPALGRRLVLAGGAPQ